MTEESGFRTRPQSFWFRELFGVFLLFWLLLLLLSLLSFSADDPSLNHAVSARREIANMGGFVGAYTAGFLNDLCGTGSLVLPLVLGVAAVLCLTRRPPLAWWRWVGVGLVCLSLLVFVTAVDLSIGDLRGGGLLGAIIAGATRRLFSPFGSTLFWLFIFAVGLQLFADLSWSGMARAVSSRFLHDDPAQRVRSGRRGRDDGEDGDGADDAQRGPSASRLVFADADEGAEAGARDGDDGLLDRALRPLTRGFNLIRRHRLRREDPDLLSDGTAEGADGSDDLAGLDGFDGSEEADGARPRRRRGRLGRRLVRAMPLVEENLPFAKLEDCGVPLDLSYAEQYAKPVPAPVFEPDIDEEEAAAVEKTARASRRETRTGGRGNAGSLMNLLPSRIGSLEEGDEAAGGVPAEAAGENALTVVTIDVPSGEETIETGAHDERVLAAAPSGEASADDREAVLDERFDDEAFADEEAGELSAGREGPRFAGADEEIFDDEPEAPAGSASGARRAARGAGRNAEAPDADFDADFDPESDLESDAELEDIAETDGPGSARAAQANHGSAAAASAARVLAGAAAEEGAAHAAAATAAVLTAAKAAKTLSRTRGAAAGKPAGALRDGLPDDPADGLADDMADDMAGEPAAAPAALSARRAASAGQAAQVSKAPAKRPSAVKIDRLYRDESADGLDDEPAVAAPGTEYVLPPLALLQKPEPALDDDEEAEDDIEERSAALMSCLADFGIQAELVRATPGPVVTTYMLRPAPGVSVRVFTRHTEDIARALMAVSVFIQAPVPGTDTVGIVIPNQHRAVVNFREIASTEAFRDAQGALPLIVGKDTTGRPYVADLARMPHLLVAGATGQGKSVCLNAMLTSLLLTRTPDRLKLLLVDPKRVEMGMYEDESHLVHPVVKEVSDAKNALLWAVHEMDERYSRMARLNTKNIIGYNARLESFKGALPADLADLEPMPYIVIVIDELADLMLQARKDVEPCIIRLAQLARACGIHMIIATQRPSVDVVTGLIKANFPCRICFRVSSRQDSMTTLGNAGAEKLLGNGDMFFNPNGGHLTRLHGPYLRDEEVQAVVDFWKKQARPNYEVDFATWGTEEEEGPARSGRPDGGERDAMYQEVLEFISEKGHVSISLLQRRFNIGYNKAARYMDQLDADGLVGPSPGAGKPRPVLR